MKDTLQSLQGRGLMCCYDRECRLLPAFVQTRVNVPKSNRKDEVRVKLSVGTQLEMLMIAADR